jgi:hypothetical protein
MAKLIGIGPNQVPTNAHLGGMAYQDSANVKVGKGVGSSYINASISGTQELDLGRYQNFILTLSGALTLSNPSADSLGQSGFIVFQQDSTGSRTVSLGSDWLTPSGSGLTLSSGANAIDVVPYIVINNGKVLLGNPQLAFA